MNEAVLEGEISLLDILFSILRNWKIVLTSILLALTLSFVYARAFCPEVYETTASMVINSKQIKVLDGELVLTNDIYLSQKMVDTYSVILLSDNVLEKVREDLDLTFPLESMRQWIRIHSPKNTEVIQVTIQHSDPELSADIANSMMKVAPEVIHNTIEVGSITVLDYAKVPQAPQCSSSGFYVALGGTLGLGFGLFLVFLQIMLKPTIRTKENLTSLTHMRYLGAIPHLKKSSKHPSSGLVSSPNAPLIYKERFHMLGEKVSFLAHKEGHKTLLVTSAGMTEGKSTLAANLALSLALHDQKVLLIDLDVYKNNLMHLFTMQPEYYLDDILQKHKTFEEVMVTDSSSHLDIVFTSANSDMPPPVNKKSLFSSFLQNTQAVYDYIILDTPPALVTSDAFSYAKYCDAVIMVVRQDKESVANIQKVEQNFRDFDVALLGSVLNDVKDWSNSIYGYAKRKSMHDYTL